MRNPGWLFSELEVVWKRAHERLYGAIVAKSPDAGEIEKEVGVLARALDYLKAAPSQNARAESVAAVMSEVVDELGKELAQERALSSALLAALKLVLEGKEVDAREIIDAAEKAEAAHG